MDKKINAEQRLLASVFRHHVERKEIDLIIKKYFRDAKFKLRSISFQDLARDSVQEVTIESSPVYEDLYARRVSVTEALKKIEPTLQVRFKGDMFS